MTAAKVKTKSASALGDVRRLTAGDTVFLYPGADGRKDWGRYLDAIAAAVSRGADVVWVRRG
jgi:hypothetical protein